MSKYVGLTIVLKNNGIYVISVCSIGSCDKTCMPKYIL